MTEAREDLEPEDRALLERIARWIAERRLCAPALLFLESVKPLHFVGSQMLVFFEPMVKAVVTGREYSRFAALMERRDAVETLLILIEGEAARVPPAKEPGK